MWGEPCTWISTSWIRSIDMAICSLTWPNYSLCVHARSRSPTLYTRTHTQIKLKDTSCPLLKLTHVIVLCCEIVTAVQCCYYTSQPWSLLLLLIFLQLYILRYSANGRADRVRNRDHCEALQSKFVSERVLCNHISIPNSSTNLRLISSKFNCSI